MKRIQNIENYTIDIESDIHHCLPKIEINNIGTLLVIKGRKVVGTLTDGDIRKALINNRLLSISVKSIMKVDYKYGINESSCMEVFEKYFYISLVPQIDEDKNLVNIFLREN
jgi:predicted transcriptional regulator